MIVTRSGKCRWWVVCGGVLRYDPAPGASTVRRSAHRRSGHAAFNYDVAESAGRGAGWKRDTAGQWRQEEHAWHTAGWSHQSLAGKPVHEPFSEILADHRKGRILSGSGRELRGRFCDPRPPQGGRGAGLDADGHEPDRINSERSENPHSAG